VALTHGSIHGASGGPSRRTSRSARGPVRGNSNLPELKVRAAPLRARSALLPCRRCTMASVVMASLVGLGGPNSVVVYSSPMIRNPRESPGSIGAAERPLILCCNKRQGSTGTVQSDGLLIRCYCAGGAGHFVRREWSLTCCVAQRSVQISR
jgi:hypothetical protein